MSLSVRNGYQSYGPTQPAAFQITQDNPGGPTPGMVNVLEPGTDVDLTAITVPGLCWMQNLDSTYAVEYGIYDPETLAFYPLGEILPGEAYPIRLARSLGYENYGTASATVPGSNTNRLHFRPLFAPTGTICKVQIDAFEK